MSSGARVQMGKKKKNLLEHNSIKHNQKTLSTTADPYPQSRQAVGGIARESLGCQGRPKLLREDRRSEAGAAGAVAVAESADECTSGASNELGLVTTPETVGARGSALG